MDDPAASTTIRPLARSLDPLTGESLGGYLLRLACRLHLTPIKLARRTGCAGTQLSRRLLLDLDVAGFARAARLTFDQTAALTLVPWADRYPPIARSQDIRGSTAGCSAMRPDTARSAWPATAVLYSCSTAAPGRRSGTCPSPSPAPATGCFSGKTAPAPTLRSQRPGG